MIKINQVKEVKNGWQKESLRLRMFLIQAKCKKNRKKQTGQKIKVALLLNGLNQGDVVQLNEPHLLFLIFKTVRISASDPGPRPSGIPAFPAPVTANPDIVWPGFPFQPVAIIYFN